MSDSQRRSDFSSMSWRDCVVWRDSGDGYRRKVTSDTEKAGVLLEWRDSRRLPPGYHFHGFRMVFSLEGLHSWSEEHVYVHAFTVRFYLDTETGVMDIYDAREVSRIVEALENGGRWPDKVQPYRQRITWDGIEASSKGATATIGERLASKRVRF